MSQLVYNEEIKWHSVGYSSKKSQCSTFYIFFFNFYSSSGKKIITTWKNIVYTAYGKKRKIRILDLFPLKLLFLSKPIF